MEDNSPLIASGSPGNSHEAATGHTSPSSQCPGGGETLLTVLPSLRGAHSSETPALRKPSIRRAQSSRMRGSLCA